jgi:serine protease Do
MTNHVLAQAATAKPEPTQENARVKLTDGAASAEGTKNSTERARDGVVTLERAGKVIAVGTVLNGDGRILTALSPLSHGNNINARYADGSVSRVRIGHVDRGWDLALLIPQNGRWRKGLKPSKKSPTAAGLALRSVSQVGEKSMAFSRTIVRGTNTLLGSDSALLRDALELASRFKENELGTPILDENGDVVALVAKACEASEGGDDCKPVPYGVPITAVKAFLRTVPPSAVPPAPWLGIQGLSEDTGPVRGVRVVGVHPQSPAAAGGLRGGRERESADIVVAVDSAPVVTPEALAEAINNRAVGDSVQLLVYGGGKFRNVSVVLRSAPDNSKSKRLAPKSPRKPKSEPAKR